MDTPQSKIKASISSKHAGIFSICWGVVITFLSLIPGKTLPELDFWDWLAMDKIGHFSVYTIWTMGVLFATYGKKNPAFKWTLCLGAYSILLEIMQGLFYQDRFFEISDIVANCAGILLGWKVFLYLNKQRLSWNSHSKQAP